MKSLICIYKYLENVAKNYLSTSFVCFVKALKGLYSLSVLGKLKKYFC